MPSIEKIKTFKLYSLIQEKKQFVLRIGTTSYSYWTPSYYDAIKNNSVIAFNSNKIKHCLIGLVTRLENTLVYVRRITRFNEADLSTYTTVHRQDILCILKDVNTLWRLWMETSTNKGTTIKISSNFNKLFLLRQKLESIAEEEDKCYFYYLKKLE